MKQKWFFLKDSNKNRKGMMLFWSIVVVMVLLLSIDAFDELVSLKRNSAKQHISGVQAESIALEHAGLAKAQVTFVNTSSDYDDNRSVYDIEFYSGNVEYDYEIDASSGRIIESDREIEYYTIPNSAVNKSNSGQASQPVLPSSGNELSISEEEAKLIALSDAGFSEAQVKWLKVKLEREDGVLVYEVDFEKDRTEYDYEIDAIKGTIIKSDVDYYD